MTIGPGSTTSTNLDEMPLLDAPPPSSTLTLDLDMEIPYQRNLARADNPHPRTDISAVRIKAYHERCNQRLDHALKLLRDREQRDRAAQSRGPKKQRLSNGSAAIINTPTPPTSTSASGSVPISISASLDSRDRQWKLVRESSDIRVYRHIRRKQRTSTIMAHGTIYGSLSDVMNGLYAETTQEARVLHALLSKNYLDASVIHVDKLGHDQAPFQFAGITWMAIKTPGMGLCKNRDLLCFKKMNIFKDDLGEEIGYMVLESIDNDYYSSFGGHPLSSSTITCAPSNRHNRYVRGQMSLVVLFKKNQDDDRVTMFVHGDFNPKGQIPPLFGDLMIAECLVSMANTVQSGQAKNLTLLLRSFNGGNAQQAILARAHTLGGKDRCGVCARSLFFWDLPQHCRGCWQRVCRSCRVKKPIFCAHNHRHSIYGANSKKYKPQAPCTEIFCLQCVCSVIPSGVTMNARLLRQLEKKRKRSAPSAFRQTITSSMTDVGGGSIVGGQGIPHPMMTPEQCRAAEAESISVLSSMESEKLQQHRLSITSNLNKQQPVKRSRGSSLIASEAPTPATPPRERAEQSPKPTTMLEVLEHFQYQTNKASHQNTPPTHHQRRTNTSLFYGMPSSGASFRSASSTEYMTNNSTTRKDYENVSIQRRSGRINGTAGAARPHHHAIIAAALRKDPVPMERRGPNAKVLPPQQHQQQPPRDDEYYHKKLQRYLLRTQSSLSNSSSFGGVFTAGSSSHHMDDLEEVGTIRSVQESISSDSTHGDISNVSVSSSGIYRRYM